MQLHLLGTGTPILDTTRPASSAFLVDLGSQKLLFDTGRGTTIQLLNQGFSPTVIDAIFITHHHYDHICDLGEVLMAAWHNGRVDQLTVYGPQGTAAIIDALLQQVFAHDIAFNTLLDPDGISIHDLVRVVEIDNGWQQETDLWTINAEYVNHGNSLGLSEAEWPCLGYRLMAEGKVLTIGGDTVDCPGIRTLAARADALLLSCYLTEAEVAQLDATQLAEHVIATSTMAGAIATQTGVSHLILTHFRKKSPALMDSLVNEVRAQYSGKLTIGQDLKVVPI